MTFNVTGNDTYPPFVGFIASGVAVVFFGSNYVPVKKIEAYDGVAFQFFMATGIWLVGLAVHLFRQCPRVFPLAMLGGAMWTTGNMCVVPILQTIGLSLGILVWGCVNMLSGWASGRFGWFDIPAKQPAHLALNYAGVGVSILASVLVFFMSPTPQTETIEITIDGNEVERQRQTRQQQPQGQRRSWRQFSDQCDSVSIFEEEIRVAVDSSVNRANGDGPDDAVNDEDDDDDVPLLDARDETPKAANSETRMQPWKRLSPAGQRITGLVLCLLIGPLFGLGFEPALYVQSHVEGASQNGLDFVFAHFTGILASSSLYFFLYCLLTGNRPTVNAASAMPAAVSGVMWGVACASWFLANEILSTAVTFPIVTTVPAVLAALWGVLVFREIRGARNLLLLLGALIVTATGSVLTGLSTA